MVIAAREQAIGETPASDEATKAMIMQVMAEIVGASEYGGAGKNGLRPGGGAGAQVALFMDWENIHLGLAQIKRLPNISAIMEEAQSIGKVAIARAYADFSYSTLQDAPENLYRVGVEPIYVFGRHKGAAQKNSVDMKLAADCMNVCYRHPEIDTYILATGDGDFIHLVNELKPHGKTVIIVTLSWAASTRLIGSADRAIYYDQEIDPADHQIEAPMVEEPREGVGDQDVVFAAIKKIVEDQQGTPIMLSALRQLAESRISNLGEVMERLGHKRFRDLAIAADRAGHVIVEVRGMAFWVRSAGLEAAPSEASPDGAADNAIPPAYGLGAASEERLRLVILCMDRLDRTRPYITFGYLLKSLMRESWAVNYDEMAMRELLDAAVNNYGMFIKSEYEKYDEYQRAQVIIPTLELNRESDKVRGYLAA